MATPWPVITHPDDLDLDLIPFRQMAAGQLDRYAVEKRFIHKQGHPVWARLTLSLVRDGRGQPDYEIAIIEDIGQRKQAEEALRHSEQRLRAIFDNAGVGIVEVETDDHFIAVNYEACQILGRTREELLATNVHTLTWPEDRDLSDQMNDRIHSGFADRVSYEKRYRRGDGSPVWVNVTISAVRDFDGTWRRSITTVEDISVRKRAEEELLRSEAQFRDLAEAMPQLVWISRPDGYGEYYNRRWHEYTGSLFQESSDEALAELLHPDDREPTLQRWRHCLQTGEPYDNEFRMQGGADRNYRWFLARALPVRDANGKIIRWFGTCTDIHRQKQAEEAARYRSQSLRILADSAMGLMMEERPENFLPVVFQRLADHLGLAIFLSYVAAQVGQQLRLISSAGLDESWRRRLDRLDFGEGVCGTVAQRQHPIIAHDIQKSTDKESYLLRSLGIRAYVCYPLLAQGRLMGTLSFGSAVHDRFTEEQLELLRTICDQVAMAMERKRLMEELSWRADELASAKASAERARNAAEQASREKDHFLAVLSHELRTPLTPVVMGVSLLQGNRNLDPVARDTLEMIHRNVEMEARLIDDLLDLTRITRGKVELQKEHVELSSVIHRALEVCRPDIEARGLDVGLDLGSGAPHWVAADVARLQQVFWNLLKNAIKFTPNGGCVGVRCHQRGNEVIAEVTDSGIGIEPEMLGRIFDAFEQAERSITRQFGGLGLGLAISKALVEMHGGRIEARSEGRNKGATFLVRLPLVAPANISEKRTLQIPAHRVGRPLRILLVEDHGVTARMMKTVLTAEGHAVETAGDVATALKLAECQPFDLLLSDLGLPDGSGHDLMRELRARGHTFPGIALSGYGQEEDVRRSRDIGFSAHLTKPASRETVINAVATIGEGT